MSELTLEKAQAIVAGALRHAAEAKLKPLGVAVHDARGALIAFAAQDGNPLKRAEVAMGKAQGALAMGVSSRTLGKMAAERPHFVAALPHVVGALVPVPGGVLIRVAAGGKIIGAVGISGDTSDNDEAAALAGIQAIGLSGDAG